MPNTLNTSYTNYSYKIDEESIEEEMHYNDDDLILWNLVKESGNSFKDIYYPLWCRDSLGIFSVYKKYGNVKYISNIKLEYFNSTSSIFNNKIHYALHFINSRYVIRRLNSLIEKYLNPIEIEGGYSPTKIIYHNDTTIVDKSHFKSVILSLDSSYFDSPFTISLITAIYRAIVRLARSPLKIRDKEEFISNLEKIEDVLDNRILSEYFPTDWLLINSKKFTKEAPVTGWNDKLLKKIIGSKDVSGVAVYPDSFTMLFPEHKKDILIRPHSPLNVNVFYGNLGFLSHLYSAFKLINALEKNTDLTKAFPLSTNLITYNIIKEYFKNAKTK